MRKERYTVEIGGKTLTAELNDLADQADGSVLVSYGNTSVLATVVMSEKPSQAGYFPLVVDYEEKFYAAGAILGSRFMRREGRPSEDAVLSARIVDRTIRPLFEHHIRNEIQVVITVLSIAEDDPDILAIIATSLALGVSDIPWNGPVSAVRVGTQNGADTELSVNPDYTFRKDARFDMVICGKDNEVTMIEAEAQEAKEKVVNTAFDRALEEIRKIQEFQTNIIKKKGRKKRALEAPRLSQEGRDLFTKEIEPKLRQFVLSNTPGKEKIKELQTEWEQAVKTELSADEHGLAFDHFETRVDELIHTEAIDSGSRPDGRSVDEVRPLYAQAGGLSEVVHGSGIFYRGGTHILSVLTLGGPSDALLIDQIETQDTKKHFMHHYNFPPFSVGETGRVGGFNRRMIGHGALAEKALKAVLPRKEDFPYTIRVVSEAMASNGSTSMGAVCGSTLALMDGGVPITAPVAGIAMGLMLDRETGQYTVLTDIQGPEDQYGDMDFKVAGTRNGVTAIQMDTKLSGIPVAILKEALEGAQKARYTILDTIEAEISAPRPSLSPNAPEIVTLRIKPEQIGLVIGPGGKTVNEIRDATGADIDIEDDGVVFITGRNGGAEKAKKAIEDLTHEYKKGEVYTGEVVKIMDFGAFVRIGPGTEGLVHVSEIAPFRVEKVEDVLKEGDRVPIVIKDIDDKDRLKLSIKDRDPTFIPDPQKERGGKGAQ